MALNQITPFIGAEFTGVTYEDFQQPELWNQFVEQLHQRELVVVRSIALTPQQQLELAARLGRPIPFVLDKYRHPDFQEIMISSNEVRDNKPIGIARVGNFWHQDSSFVANPAPYTLLHGIKVPSDSGHTLFANAADVYDRLPQEWKARIEGRKALHTVSKRLRIQAEHVGLSVAEFKAWIETKHPKVEHDLVKVDPDTGRKYLYGAPEYLDSVIGLDANDNAAFFALIDELIQAPQRVYTHEWSNNDLVAWKTQTTLHAVTDVEPGVDRTVHRISIELH